MSSIGSFQSLLEQLDFSGNSFALDNGSAIEESACIGRCGRLRELRMKACNIGNNQLKTLCNFVVGRCISLNHLDLSFNQFSDKGLAILLGRIDLEIL